jgi:hypothetical protein
LDEVQKAAVALLRWNLYLSQPDKELIDIPEKEQMFRIVLEETDDEQKLRCRK